MNNDKIVSHNNKVAGSLFASAKFVGIVAVCMFYMRHRVVGWSLLGLDAVLLIVCVVVCIRNMNLANSLESTNAKAKKA
jgi:hypothetical protein